MSATVLVVLVSLLGGVPAANATARVQSRADRTMPRFSHAHARAVLARAKSQLRRDTARLRAHRPVGSSPETDITMTLRDLFLARPSLTGQERQQADAILARPSDNPDVDDDVVKWDAVGRANQTNDCTGPVCVHWVDKVGDKDYATNAFAAQVKTVMQNVWNAEIGGMGYKAPLADTAAGDVTNPDSKVDVYLANLTPSGLYGYCAPDASSSGRKAPAYCVLDNDFAGYGTTPTKALDVTAAHEFFHAIQFAYDDAEDSWFMEGTATWMEDEVYDSINDNLQFLGYSPIRFPTAPVDLTTDFHRYGSWIFFKYASERLGRDVVRQMWQLADASTGRYSLQAIRSAVSARVSWAPFMATFAAWNLKQPHGYSEDASYPWPTWAGTRVLSKKHKSTGWLVIDLPHLSSAPLRIIPASTLKPNKHLVITVNLPPTSHGSAFLVQRRYRNGTVFNSMLALNAKGDGHARIAFNRKALSYVALIPANTSTSMVYCGFIAGSDGGPAYSCAGRGVYDYGQRYEVRAKVR